ncbi:MAG: transglycosylase SLT domain-containing protein [Aestuariivirga sp.]|nr:transglycosylase SLT domain-containing protein [Aestuariivirga sp.]
MAKKPNCWRLVLAVAMGFLSSLYASSASMAASLNVCEREMISASTRHKVPLGVLYAVGLTETGRKGSLHPYALNIEGKTVFTNSERAAMKSFKVARLTGKKLIDLGCMQVNHHYHGDKFSSVEDMLDPQKNVEYAAKFLSELRVQEGSWTMAVARYHAGPNNNAAQKRYVCLVIKNLVASDFGAWTPEARKFCR